MPFNRKALTSKHSPNFTCMPFFPVISSQCLWKQNGGENQKPMLITGSEKVTTHTAEDMVSCPHSISQSSLTWFMTDWHHITPSVFSAPWHTRRTLTEWELLQRRVRCCLRKVERSQKQLTFLHSLMRLPFSIGLCCFCVTLTPCLEATQSYDKSYVLWTPFVQTV